MQSVNGEMCNKAKAIQETKGHYEIPQRGKPVLGCGFDCE